MEFATLNNGVPIPMLGSGLFRLTDQEEAARTVRSALKNGYRHLDTAAVYKNEAAVGRGIREGQELLRECGFRRFCTFRQREAVWHAL